MIVSHSRRFIFIKTFKTGGTSLEIALSKHCGNDDVITPLNPSEELLRTQHRGLSPRNYRRRFEELNWRQRLRMLVGKSAPTAFNEHLPAWKAMQRIGRDTWDSYFKFCVVRNPYDRFLSRFYFNRGWIEERGEKQPYDLDDIDQFARYRPELINENWRMYTRNDRVMMDFVVRYERMAEDLAVVSERIGLSHNLIEDMATIRAKDSYRPKESEEVTLSGDQKELIRLLCRKEIDAFYKDA